jgi:virginiamycin B lyase
MTYFTKGISSGVALQDITLGPDGALWFTESTGDRIGRITKRGKITEYSAGITPGAKPYSIAPGPDGALWFTEIAGARIGRITTSGHVTEFSRGITSGEGPVDLAAGSDGAIWFTEYQSCCSYQVNESKIGRITMSGKVTEYSTIAPQSAPTTIVQGPDRNMWFVEMDANRTGRVTL